MHNITIEIGPQTIKINFCKNVKGTLSLVAPCIELVKIIDDPIIHQKIATVIMNAVNN